MENVTWTIKKNFKLQRKVGFHALICLVLLPMLLPFICSGQILISSEGTAEAMSKFPDQPDDLPADLKIRKTTNDTASYQGFVKFDISYVNADLLSDAAVVTWGGQHNPSGTAMIDSYYVDMYGCNTVAWPEPFTWNSTRSMHQGALLASANIQGARGGYTFGGQEVADWIKAKKAEGATEVVFRFHARGEHPWDIWLSGTWKGMELKIEYTEPSDDPASYTDTVAKINFTDPAFDEPGWTGIYSTTAFPAELGNGVKISVPGNRFISGFDGAETSVLPQNTGKVYHYVEETDNEPVEMIISGLEPSGNYRLSFFSGTEETGGTGADTTFFYVRNSTDNKEGEFLILDKVYTYDDNLNGFKWVNLTEVEEAPANWKVPYDYEYGEIFERYEVISQPTSQQALISFGIWQDGGARETVSTQTPVYGPGSVGTRNSSPSTWWEKDEDNPVDFTRPSDFLHFGMPLWSDQYKLVAPPGYSSNGDWDRRHLYHPMTVRSTVVAVPEGGSFSGWNFWLNLEREVSINPAGNVDSLLSVSPVTASADGEIVVRMSKKLGARGIINAMIVTQQGVTRGKQYSRTENIVYYPVPVKDFLTLNKLPENCTISLYDVQGRKMVEEVNSFGAELKIDLRKCRPGIYLVRIVNFESSMIKKFKVIKE